MMSTQQIAPILANLGISALNPMQEAAGQAIAEDHDTVLVAPTGSGKTIAFLLPVLGLLKPNQTTVQCLVLAPSRELALQIESVWKKMATGFKVNSCYGGHPVETEIRNLSNPPALLVGTPGRIADHLDRRSFDTGGIHTLVLDEFDKSLELGFQDEMGFIVKQLTGLRKQVLVSATHGIKIPEFVRLRNPQTVIHQADEETLAALTMKVVYSPEKDKVETLFNLLCTLDSEPALIFLNHREAAERTRDELGERGIQAGVYHGGMEQPDRERALIQFRNGSVRYLITTDLAARGLDIPEMNYVIHYHLPLKGHEFVHRNGRTARMHRTGGQASGTVYVILSRDENHPDYLPNKLDEFSIPAQTHLPNPPEFVTVYVSGGRKNKLNKVDIVGFFGQKGQLEKGDLGRIDVQDFISFAAVKREKVTNLLTQIQDEKMKGKKYKIEVAR